MKATSIAVGCVIILFVVFVLLWSCAENQHHHPAPPQNLRILPGPEVPMENPEPLLRDSPCLER